MSSYVEQPSNEHPVVQSGQGQGALIISAPAEHLRWQLETLGGNGAEVLRQIGLCGSLFDKQPFVMPLHASAAFAQQAAMSLSRPDFGWIAGQTFDLKILGPVGYAIQTASTVGDALKLFCQNFHAVQNVSRLSLLQRNGVVILRYRILDPDIWPRDQDAELTLSVLSGLLRQSRGVWWRPDKLYFEHSAPFGKLFEEDRARSGVVYNHVCNEIHFPVDVLKAPMPDCCRRSHQQYITESLAVQRSIDSIMQLPDRVRQQILMRFGIGSVEQSDIANELGLSRRSLRRQLADCDTSYSRELAKCRYDYTCLQLRSSKLPIADIALEVGYSDQTAFERAFRRHCGLTPTQYRKQHDFSSL